MEHRKLEWEAEEGNIRSIRTSAERQKSQAEAENVQLRTELAAGTSQTPRLKGTADSNVHVARKQLSSSEQDLSAGKQSSAAITLERERLLECHATNSARLKQVEAECELLHEQLRTANAEKEAVIDSARENRCNATQLQLQVDQLENQLQEVSLMKCELLTLDGMQAEASGSEAVRQVREQLKTEQDLTQKLKREQLETERRHMCEIERLEKRLSELQGNSDFSGVPGVSTDTLLEPAELLTNRINAMSVRLEEEQARVLEELKQKVQAENRCKELEHVMSQGRSRESMETEKLRIALDQAQIEIGLLAESKAQLVSKLETLEQNGEHSKLEQALASERAVVSKTREKCDRMAVEASRVEREMREQARLLQEEELELMKLTTRCNDLEASLCEAKQQAAHEQVLKRRELMASNDVIRDAEERTKLMEVQMQELEKQLEILTKDSVKMKSAFSATLRQCEKHGTLHAQRVQELEINLEKAKLDSDAEKRRVKSQLKEMETRLANSTRENAALRRMNYPNTHQIDLSAHQALSSSEDTASDTESEE